MLCRAIWKSKTLVEWHQTQDQWGRPGGLGWGSSMRWGTAAALLDMMDSVQRIMSEVDFPVLALHDPQDGIVPHAGTMMLMQRAKSTDKTCIEMRGSLHDQMCNSPVDLTKAISEWTQKRSRVAVTKNAAQRSTCPQ